MTIENFLTWKKDFEEWKAEGRKRAARDREELIKGKLTGRQLFMQDASLNDSDVKFLEAGEEEMKDLLQGHGNGFFVKFSKYESASLYFVLLNYIYSYVVLF